MWEKGLWEEGDGGMAYRKLVGVGVEVGVVRTGRPAGTRPKRGGVDILGVGSGPGWDGWLRLGGGWFCSSGWGSAGVKMDEEVRMLVVVVRW